MNVGFQGFTGAYSEEAALKFFGKDIRPCPFDEFEDVFKAVKSGRVDYGVLPVENSLTGSVHQNYDLLLTKRVWIAGEVKLRVSHNLLVKKGTRRGQITQVYSHPQALMQCHGYLRKNKSVAAMPFFDTAASAKFVAASPERHVAAIASQTAAMEYGLKVLDKSIEDNEQNFTRFIVIQKGKGPALDPRHPRKGAGDTKGTADARGSGRKQELRKKTSIVFNLKSIPGALHKALSVLSIRDIDLAKIESRPIPGNPWEYQFYLDFFGDHQDDACRRAIKHLGEISNHIYVLGSYYPAA